MQEYANAKLNFENGDVVNDMMTAVQDILSEYSFEEPDKCNWSDYLAIQKNSVVINSVAMCGWLDFIDLFKAICTKLSEDYHDEFFVSPLLQVPFYNTTFMRQ